MKKHLVFICIFSFINSFYCIKNTKTNQYELENSSGDKSNDDKSIVHTDKSIAQSDVQEYYKPSKQQSSQLSKAEKNFIITHEGLFHYQPVSRSLQDLDQEYKASSTYFKSEVIPVSRDGIEQNTGLLTLPSKQSRETDVSTAFTSSDAVSVPLHVGFQVENSNSAAVRMNPKGKVLNFDEDLNFAANNNNYNKKKYYSMVPTNKNQYNVAKSYNHMNDDLHLESTNNNYQQMPMHYTRQVESANYSPSNNNNMNIHQSANYNNNNNMDLVNAASSYYKDVSQNQQKHMNPYYRTSKQSIQSGPSSLTDLELAASDPRSTFESYRKQSRHNKYLDRNNFIDQNQNHNNNFDLQLSPSEPNQSFEMFKPVQYQREQQQYKQQQQKRDQHLEESKVYNNGGGDSMAKSYVDYVTTGDLDSRSGQYENAPVHFGFQVEHPRIQSSRLSSGPSIGNSGSGSSYNSNNDYHPDYKSSAPIPKSSKIRIPKIPKVTKPYVPSVEDIDDDIDIESDFKHIKIKKYSTNNDFGRYGSDEIANPSKQNFKYTNLSNQPFMKQQNNNNNNKESLENQQLSTLANENYPIIVPSLQVSTNDKTGYKIMKKYNKPMSGQSSQKYYQYIKPKNLLKRSSNLPVLYYV